MNGLKRTLLVIVLLAAAAFLSWEALKVRDIVVVGTNARLPGEVVALSGIRLGDSLLTLDRDSARSGIESNPYFKYEEIAIDWPSGIVVRITERVPKAYAAYMDSMIVMDETGFVLEIRQGFETVEKLTKVSGLQVTTYLVGQRVTASNQDQVVIFGQVYEILENLGLKSDIREINVTQALTVKIVTKQGITVDIGTPTDMRKKIQLMNAIVDNLITMYGEAGLDGATLDVSTGEMGDFDPTGGR